MKIKRVFTVVKMELKRMFSDPLSLIFTMLLVPVLILLFGLMMGDSYGWDPTETYSVFDIMFPGFLAYGSLLTIYDVAASVAGERELGIQKRINTTPLTSAEYILAQMISYTVKPLVQFALGFGIGYAVGYRPTVGIVSYLLVILFLVLLTFSSVGFGLITSNMAKSAGAAGGLAFVFIVPQQLFATFIPAAFMGAESFAWIFPSYYATEGIGYLFAGALETHTAYILGKLLILLAISVVIYTIGIILYEIKKKS